jgi:hypothetical protein
MFVCFQRHDSFELYRMGINRASLQGLLQWLFMYASSIKNFLSESGDVCSFDKKVKRKS